MKRQVMRLRELWWDWNPKRLRRLLKQAKIATDNNAYGWANTQQELVKLKKELQETQDTLNLSVDYLISERKPELSNGVDWRNIATMLSHFDVCTSARIECNICHEARQAYLVGLTT